MRKIILSLLVAATAVSMSAFTSASSVKNSNNQTTWYYVLNAAGTQYRSVGTSQPNQNLCNEADMDQCIIGFASNQGATVNPNALPAQKTFESDTNGYVQ